MGCNVGQAEVQIPGNPDEIEGIVHVRRVIDRAIDCDLKIGSDRVKSESWSWSSWNSLHFGPKKTYQELILPPIFLSLF